jgi:hypothetical protein
MKKSYTKATATRRQPLAAVTAQVVSGPVAG